MELILWADSSPASAIERAVYIVRQHNLDEQLLSGRMQIIKSGASLMIMPSMWC